MKAILYIALVFSIATYSFWGKFPKGSFYIGNAIFILMLCVYLFLKDRKSFVCYVLMCYALNNLIDELRFDNTKLGLNEIVFGILTPVLWLIKHKIHARKIHSK